jgi:hypothetical protein
MNVKYTEAHGHRTKLLRHARDLARSGEHEDHRSIVAALGSGNDPGEARRWLTDRLITAQLDKLCGIAQTSAPANARTLAAWLTSARASKAFATGP